MVMVLNDRQLSILGFGSMSGLLGSVPSPQVVTLENTCLPACGLEPECTGVIVPSVAKNGSIVLFPDSHSLDCSPVFVATKTRRKPT